MIEQPLAAEADVNAAPAESYGQNTLWTAAERGHLDIMQRLQQQKSWF